VTCAETDEPIEIPFGVWTSGAQNHGHRITWRPDPLWEGYVEGEGKGKVIIVTCPNLPAVDILNVIHKGAEATRPFAAIPL